MVHPLIANRRVQLRHVPWSLSVPLLLGGMLPQVFGWAWLGFSMFFVWVFALHSDFSTALQLHARLERAQGKVVSISETGASENDRRIYRIRYSFAPTGGAVQEGTSYATGNETEQGATVTVEYRPDKPAVSRIEGMRSAEFSWWVALIILIFPTIGLIFIIVCWRKGWKRIVLLQRGAVAYGRFVSLEATNVEVNDRRVMAARFTFTTPEGREYPVTYRTTSPDQAWASTLYGAPDPERVKAIGNLPLVGGWLKKKIEQKSAEVTEATQQPIPDEPILYDPAYPQRAMLQREVGNVTLTETDVRGGSPGLAIAVLILPLLVVLSHGWYVVKVLCKG